MKLLSIRKRVLCGGLQKYIENKWQYVDASEVYLIPAFVYSRSSKTISVRFLIFELWFRYQNESSDKYPGNPNF